MQHLRIAPDARFNDWSILKTALAKLPVNGVLCLSFHSDGYDWCETARKAIYRQQTDKIVFHVLRVEDTLHITKELETRVTL